MERGLIIRSPWIELILEGKKTWEMRSKPTDIRGTIGLIKQGSGLVLGAAKLVDSKPALSPDNYMKYRDKHAIPDSMLEVVLENRWIYPWVLSDVCVFEKPVPSNHRRGGVTFVFLNFSQFNSNRKETDVDSQQWVATPQTQPSSKYQDNSQVGTFVARNNPDRSSSSEEKPLFEFQPEKALAYGRPLETGEFLVLAGSTAMRNGSPKVKRDTYDRDRLVKEGTLIPDSDPNCYRFVRDCIFSSPSKAAGIVKDGNASGPSLWRTKTGLSLKDYLAKH